MRIVVDTNIAFSAILKSNGLIARIILQPKSKLHFYSTDLLSIEIHKHKNKLKQFSGLSDSELDTSIFLIKSKIRFIDAKLIPTEVLLKAQELSADIDIDDSEFIALTNHIRGKLWSGDKILQRGLEQKGWTKFISTQELYEIIIRK
jgi:predicted nucleic acid-binding protein